MMIDEATFYKGDEFSGDEDPRYSDRNFIDSEIQKLPFWARSKVLIKYSNVFQSILDREDIPKVNRISVARRECNIRLRKAVENLSKPHLPEH